MRPGALLLAVLAAISQGPAATAEEPLPPTLDRLYQAPVEDAAKLALGAGAQGYVERLKGNSVQGNYVLGTVNLYGVRFFKRPERVGPGVCRVGMGEATFEAPGVDFVMGGVAGGGSPGVIALKPRAAGELTVYYAAHPAAGAKPGGQAPHPNSPPTPGSGDDCSGPVEWRDVFEAQSAEAAVSAVTSLERAVSAARSSTRLKFEVSGVCAEGPCKDARAALAGLDLSWITGLESPPCRSPDHKAAACRSLTLKADSSDSADWFVSVNEDAKANLVSVRLEYAQRPVI